MAGRLIEQWQKFWCQFSADTWWTNAENFMKIAWFVFDVLLINWFFSECLAPSMVTFDQKCTKVTKLGAKLSEKNQLISYDSNMNQAIELKFSGDVHQVSALNWRKNFCPCSTSLPATAHFGQNFGWLLRQHLLEFFFEKNFGEVLDLYQLAIGRNFEYLEKNGVFKFFKSLPVHLITKSTITVILKCNGT